MFGFVKGVQDWKHHWNGLVVRHAKIKHQKIVDESGVGDD